MKKLEKLRIFLKQPLAVIMSGLFVQNEKLLGESVQKQYKITKLPTIDITELFPDLDEEVTTYSYLEGVSLVTDIILLKKMARRFPACNYLEIGSWRGESLKNVSEVAAHCTSITLSPEEMAGMNLSKNFIATHDFFSKNIKNVTRILHNSFTFDFNQLNQKFDLIFIDADHSYEGILNDTRKTFNLRKDSSSIIVWHDYGNSPEKVRNITLKAILDGIPVEYHKNLYHVSNTLCAVYIENNTLPSYQSSFPAIPTKNFSLKVKAQKV